MVAGVARPVVRWTDVARGRQRAAGAGYPPETGESVAAEIHCAFKGTPCTSDGERGIPGACAPEGDCRHKSASNADCPPTLFCYDAAIVGLICVTAMGRFAVLGAGGLPRWFC
jgi:hypothetical protein